MSRARKMFIMIVLGVVMLSISIIVWVLNRDVSTDLLAVIGVLGGLAAVVIILPTNGNIKNGKNGKNGGLWTTGITRAVAGSYKMARSWTSMMFVAESCDYRTHRRVGQSRQSKTSTSRGLG